MSLLLRRIFLSLLVGTWAGGAFAFTVPWGDGPDQLGLNNQPEQERTGPLTFAVSSAGTLYVADTVHGAVKEFNAEGKYARTVLSNARPSHMAFDASGNLMLLDGHGVSVHRQSGEKLRTIDLPDSVPLVEGYAQEVFEEDGLLGVNDPDQKVYLFDPEIEKPTRALAVEWGRRWGKINRAGTDRVWGAGASISAWADQPAAVVGGAAVPSSAYLAPTVSIGRRFGAVIYRGTAGPQQGRVVETEEIEAGRVHLLLRAIDAPGNAATELPNDYFTTIYKKFEVLPDGTVWQMLTTPQGVEFTKTRLSL
jgi:hypothetical protein